ncbi:MAG: hypothetical protein ACTSPZ_07695 [Promethearchaeota archaeon]
MHDTTGNRCLKRPIPRLFKDSGPSTSKKTQKNMHFTTKQHNNNDSCSKEHNSP